MKLATYHNQPVSLLLDDQIDCLHIAFEAEPGTILQIAEIGVIHHSAERLILKVSIHHDHYVDERGVKYFLLDENVPDEVVFNLPERELKLRRAQCDEPY